LIQNDKYLNSDHDDDLEEFHEQKIEYTDANMFLFSLLPLRLTFTAFDSTNDILWKNQTPSSTRYCRPIKC
jgi:hypothetical protein